MQVNIENLAEFIEYAYEGLTEYPIQAFFDIEQDKKSKYQSYWDSLNHMNLYKELPKFIDLCEVGKRALCFYLNGAKNVMNIKRIRFHFVDIDSGGGTKEEQLKRIMSAPLKPTVV